MSDNEYIASLESNVDELGAKVETLKAEKSSLEDDFDFVERERDDALSDVTEAESELDRLGEKITAAAESLRVLGDVPLQDLEQSIEDIRKALLP